VIFPEAARSTPKISRASSVGGWAARSGRPAATSPRLVVAPQAQSAIDTYEQPNRSTAISFSKMIRSLILGRWQPSG
jgi:hypothetical protein